MRVVKLIYQTYHPSQGRYPRVSGQARILREGGYDVTILACDRDGRHPPSETIEGIPVQRLPVATGEMRGPLRQLTPLMRFYRQAVDWFREHPADIVQCHNLDVLPLGWRLKRRFGCKLVFEAHEPNYYALWPRHLKPLVHLVEQTDRFLARRCDAVSVTNDYQVAKYREQGIRQVALIGNYPPPEQRIQALDPQKFDLPELVLGRFGTFYPGVGLEHTVAAYARLLALGAPVRLVLGGRVVDAYRQTFDRLIAPLGDSVTVLGAFHAGDMRALYARIHAALMIYPRTDWFRNITPRKYFDALANGVPVIMTDIGGLGDTIRRRDCGLVVDENDADATAAAIDRLARDPARWRTLARQALDCAQQEYAWETMARDYLNLMEAIHAP